MGAEPVLSVRNLAVEYATESAPVQAVTDVSFDLGPGEFLGVVGESGSGKSTMLFGIAKLLNPPARIVKGEVLFLGRDMVTMTENELRHLRWRDYSVVMQSAMNALNPVTRLSKQMRDACEAHGCMSPREIRARSEDMLRLVGIDPLHLRAFPHQLSGGMRQRAMIAMALLFTPQLVIMDEPTSSLDVVAQRSLMVQIRRLQERLGFAVIFVTHDMSLVGGVADRLAVMYAGTVVEMGRTTELFSQPHHPYTRGLLEAFPSIQAVRRRLSGVPGTPPSLAHPPPGCKFRPRCALAVAACAAADPPPEEHAGRTVRCIRAEEVAAGAR